MSRRLLAAGGHTGIRPHLAERMSSAHPVWAPLVDENPSAEAPSFDGASVQASYR